MESPRRASDPLHAPEEPTRSVAPRRSVPTPPHQPRRSAGSPLSPSEALPRRSADSPAEAPEEHQPLPRRSALTPPGIPEPHDSLPRRSATTPPEIPPPQPAATVNRPAGSGRSVWLSTLMAPLVVALSVGLGLGVAHLAAPTPDPPGQDSAPAPGTPTPATPTPSVSADPGQLLELNDASLTMPASWTITSDELVEGDRRAVRLVEPVTDARLQAVTPGAAEQTPQQACQALVGLQRQAYTDVTTHLVLELTVPGAGDGATCGFEGTRSSDGVANVVSFTLLRRDLDAHLLMLRATVPEAVPAAAEARSQLVGMQCEASRTFGVRLPLC